MPETILKIDTSARKEGSVTRQLTDQLITGLLERAPDVRVLTRDVAGGLPVIDEDWISANFTDAADRSAEQRFKLALSDTLVNELKSADAIVFGVPIYNFGIPAALKAWIDLVARARETFRYTENGPEGLLVNKKAYIVLASGGTKAGSQIDFASGYMLHMLGFLGINDVSLIAADQLMQDGEQKRKDAILKIRMATQQAA